MGDFYQICIVCGQLHVRSCSKIWVDSRKGFRSYRSLGLGVCELPQIFSAFSGETMRRRRTCFKGTKMVQIFCIFSISIMTPRISPPAHSTGCGPPWRMDTNFRR